jgi:pyridoxal phosphate enzyme (YggS family)
LPSIFDNLRCVLDNIAASAARAGRDPSEVRLVAVTKNVDAARICSLVSAGVGHLGENRVQEAAQKIPQVAGSPTWHLVGHLQRNKARHAVELFSVLQSLDSLELAAELDRRCATRGVSLDALLQVNISGESTKYGVAPDAAAGMLREMPRFEHLRVLGLMTMAPYSEDAEDARVWFRALRHLAGELSTLRLSNVAMDELSMGMSGDYQVAVEEGSTIVRVGTAIFGPRVR